MKQSKIQELTQEIHTIRAELLEWAVRKHMARKKWLKKWFKGKPRVKRKGFFRLKR